MKVYIDLIFLLNVYLDFFILLTTSFILKRNVLIKRIFLGSIVGGFSIVLLFVSISNFLFFLLKILFSILMVICTFSFRDFKYFINNLFYLYITSLVLGGGLYLLELELNFYNIFIVFIFSLLILYLYVHELNKIKYNYNNYLKVEVVYKEDKFDFIGYIDSGNKLSDQYKNRPISLVYSDLIKYDYEDVILVPYETASGNGVLKCIKVDELIINNKKYFNSLIGLMNKKINIDGVDIILNNKYIN